VSGRHAGVELFRIIALETPEFHHLFYFPPLFNAPVGTAYWEFCVLVVTSLGFGQTGLFQLTTLFSLRSPFRAKGLTLFCLAVIVYTRTAAWIMKWGGFSDRTGLPVYRWPITTPFSWYFSAHTNSERRDSECE
jgi:hypothetical protein